jgi:N-methylhydantoinase B/oxoprolinase/acetone carboxylase alpha subunit
MGHIQNNAEVAVRDMLKLIGQQALEKTGRSVLLAADSMDDGSPIQLSVTINIQDGEAVFDFAGTGHEAGFPAKFRKAKIEQTLISFIAQFAEQCNPITFSQEVNKTP